MPSQDRVFRRRRRAHPLRWLVAILAGLLIFIPLAFTLLPKLAGGLLGRGENAPGGWAGDEAETQIVWIPNPRPESREPETQPVPPAETPEPKPTESVEPEPQIPEPVPVSPDSSAEVGGASAPPAEAAGPEASAASTAASGGVPAGEGRRSPRILFQEWPNRELLESLRSSGRIRFRLRVEVDGSVSEWEVLERFDCGPCFTEALRIVRSLRFAPGTLHGEAVVCWVPYTIEFRRHRP